MSIKFNKKNGAKISRRRLLAGIGGGIAALPFWSRISRIDASDKESGNALWNEDWNKALIAAAVKRFVPNYDEKESLLQAKIGASYRYHTNLRNTTAHVTRDSLEYAFLLLEEGGTESKKRALKIIERMLALQSAEADKPYFGLWSYYLEEPLEKMSPPDYNWADFCAAWLLLINHRHQSALPDNLKSQIHQAVSRAAECVKRRDVSPYYTNIAFAGSFVTVSAAELLEDKKLAEYATERWRKLARTIDETGSFAEYVSPTYNWVALVNIMRTRMLVKNAEVLSLNEKIHRRVWEHLAAHFHAPTAQFAAPMSRCYATDLASPVWLQKALDGRLQFISLDEIKAVKIPAESGENAIHPFECPPDLREKFLTLNKSRQHREIFVGGRILIDNAAIAEGIVTRKKEVRPVQGTTFFAPEYSLGSANRSDFWVQRRSFGLYWGDQSRPARYLQMRVLKDDYDFVSGLFYSAQNENCVLGAVNFRTPGGEKHPTLDILPASGFDASRLYLQFLINGLLPDAPVLINGKPLAKLEKVPKLDETRICIETETCRFCLAPRHVEFGAQVPKLRFVPKENGQIAIEIDLIRGKQKINWAETGKALIAFTFQADDLKKDANLAAFDERIAGQKFTGKMEKDRAHFVWQSATGNLELVAGRAVQSIQTQDEIFEEKLNGTSVPLVRLSEKRIIG